MCTSIHARDYTKRELTSAVSHMACVSPSADNPVGTTVFVPCTLNSMSLPLPAACVLLWNHTSLPPVVCVVYRFWPSRSCLLRAYHHYSQAATLLASHSMTTSSDPGLPKQNAPTFAVNRRPEPIPASQNSPSQP